MSKTVLIGGRYILPVKTFPVRFLPLLAVLLSACSAVDTKDQNSPYYTVPVGSTLVLNQVLTIDRDQVASYVQDGKVLPEKAVDKYRPNCKFEIYTMSEQARTVQPDSFEVIKIVDNIESSTLATPVQLASRGLMLGYGALDKSYIYNYATMMYLNSELQKDVYRMTCQHWEDIMDDRYLTVAQMYQAMGDVFTLQVKE